MIPRAYIFLSSRTSSAHRVALTNVHSSPLLCSAFPENPALYYLYYYPLFLSLAQVKTETRLKGRPHALFTCKRNRSTSSFAMESHTGCGCLRLNKLTHRLSAMQMNSNTLWNDLILFFYVFGVFSCISIMNHMKNDTNSKYNKTAYAIVVVRYVNTSPDV